MSAHWRLFRFGTYYPVLGLYSAERHAFHEREMRVVFGRDAFGQVGKALTDAIWGDDGCGTSEM